MHQCDDHDLQQVRLRFAEEVRKARREARLSQAALAERIGRSQRYVSDVEKGTRSLPFDTMSMIMRALGKRVQIQIRIDPIQRPRKVAKFS
jgi:predicted transcriptional regulator